MVLFDIREDESHRWWVDHINRELAAAEVGRAYLGWFDLVCSSRWWECFDRGEIPVQVLAGVVTHVGPRPDPVVPDEIIDVVEFRCGEEVVVYDRLGIWAAPFGVGDQIKLSKTRLELPHWTGPTIFHVELRAEWVPAAALG